MTETSEAGLEPIATALEPVRKRLDELAERGRDPAFVAACERRYREAAQDERARITTAARTDERHALADCGVPLRYFAEPLADDLVPPELRAWASGFPGSLAGAGGAVLAGPPGTGKTAAAVWAIRALYRSGNPVGVGTPRARWGWPGALFASLDELVRAAGRLNVSDFGAVASRLLDRARRAGLLVVDDWIDLGRDRRLEVVDALVRERWHARRPTLITSNDFPEVFRERWPALASRLEAQGGPGVVEVNRDDLRRAAR